MEEEEDEEEVDSTRGLEASVVDESIAVPLFSSAPSLAAETLMVKSQRDRCLKRSSMPASRDLP